MHWGRIDGKAKVAGVMVCVAGAVFMALYKGPALLGDGFSDLHLQGVAMAGKPAPEPVGWLAGVLIDLGIDLWHIGVICLIGNSLSMALYIVYQVNTHIVYQFNLISGVLRSWPLTTCLNVKYTRCFEELHPFSLLQAPLLASYPASLSLTAYSYAFGASFMAITGFFFANDTADWSLTAGETFAVLYAVSVFLPNLLNFTGFWYTEICFY